MDNKKNLTIGTNGVGNANLPMSLVTSRSPDSAALRRGSFGAIVAGSRRRAVSYTTPGHGTHQRVCTISGCDQPMSFRGYCAQHAAAFTSTGNLHQKKADKLASFPDFMPGNQQTTSKIEPPTAAQTPFRVAGSLYSGSSASPRTARAISSGAQSSAGSEVGMGEGVDMATPSSTSARERRRKSVVLEKEMAEKERKVNELQKELNTLRWKHATLIGTNMAKKRRDDLLANLKGQQATSPMEAAIQNILQIISNFSENQQYQMQLMEVIKSLSSPAIYQPITQQLAEDPNLSESTRSWITSTFTTYNDPSKPEKSPKDTDRKGSKDFSPSDILWELKQWNFNVWDHTYDQLLSYLMKMFYDFELFEKCNVDPENMETFLHSIRGSYRNNSYHNFVHCVDVTQTVFYFLVNTNLIDSMQMSALEIFSLLVSAICHDVDHPGLNNTFQINSKTPLALRYNDVSVLENHHSSKLFMTMYEQDADICANMTPEDAKSFRKATVQLVLNTDMTKHFELISRLKTRLDTNAFSPSNADDKSLMLSLVLHAADISNPAKPFPLADIWATKVLEEFHMQGDLELATNLPISPMCSREECNKPKQQVDFILYVVKPLFEALSTILGYGMEEPLKCIEENLKQWEMRLHANEKKEKDVSAPPEATTPQSDSDKVMASVSKMVGVNITPTSNRSPSPKQQ